jgi:hypothetical protein
MQSVPRTIPIRHAHASYSIEPSAAGEPLELTLLELVQAVGEVSDSEEEVIATVLYMLRSRKIRLAGNFRFSNVEDLCG